MKIKDRVANQLYRQLNADDQPCSPPGSEIWAKFGPEDMFTATTYNNDGFELWIAYTGGKWLAHFSAQTARQLARIILWDWWAKSTWFGLKRAVWYWALKQVSKRQKREAVERMAKVA